jgi:hypothetical protein
LRRRDVRDRLLADPREHVRLEARHDLVAVARGPLVALDGIPLARDRFEGIERRQPLCLARVRFAHLGESLPLGLALLARIEALGQQVPHRIGLAPCDSQRRVGVRAEREHVALAAEAVVEAPAMLAAAVDEQQQDEPVAIAQALARITRLDGAYRRVGRDQVTCHWSNCCFFGQSAVGLLPNLLHDAGVLQGFHATA